MITYKKLFSILGLLLLILLAAFFLRTWIGFGPSTGFKGTLGGRLGFHFPGHPLGASSAAGHFGRDRRLVLIHRRGGFSGPDAQSFGRAFSAGGFQRGRRGGGGRDPLWGLVLGGNSGHGLSGGPDNHQSGVGLAQRARTIDPNTLILTGVIINAFFAALIMFALATASGEKLHSLLFWLYGDLSRGRFIDLWVMIPVVLAGSVFLYGMARSFNLIASGEEVAAQLGVDVERAKWLSLIVVSLMCGVTVAFSGIIGFVGLLVPHLVRMAFGPDHRILLPASGLFGASFLIGADLLARTVISPSELPVGVVTAFLGPLFPIPVVFKETTMDPLIQVDRVGYRYNHQWVIQGISF